MLRGRVARRRARAIVMHNACRQPLPPAALKRHSTAPVGRTGPETEVCKAMRCFTSTERLCDVRVLLGLLVIWVWVFYFIVNDKARKYVTFVCDPN